MFDYQPHAVTIIKCSYLAVTNYVTIPLFITLDKEQSHMPYKGEREKNSYILPSVRVQRMHIKRQFCVR
jgi:hypothetical protein